MVIIAVTRLCVHAEGQTLTDNLYHRDKISHVEAIPLNLKFWIQIWSTFDWTLNFLKVSTPVAILGKSKGNVSPSIQCNGSLNFTLTSRNLQEVSVFSLDIYPPPPDSQDEVCNYWIGFFSANIWLLGVMVQGRKLAAFKERPIPR